MSNEELIANLLAAHREQVGFLDALLAVQERLELLDKKNTLPRRPDSLYGD